MAYDAVAISSNDLSAGTEFFQGPNANSFPWVAANIYDKNDNLIFFPHIIKKTANLTIGIIGLTGGENNINDFFIGDWRKALQKEIASLEQSCDILVVLSNLNVPENEEIQRDFRQIDIIVTADRKGTNIHPKVSQTNLITQSGGRGKYLGKLDITWEGKGNWLAASFQPLADRKSRLNSIDWQLSELEKKQSGESRDFSQKIERLRSYRQKITDQIEKETNSSKRFKSFFLPVKPMSSRDDITSIVQEIKTSINTFNRYRRAGLHADDPAVRLALQKDQINGITGCSTCHEKQNDFWKNTRHANAYATLAQLGQSFNLQCLPCHVTAGQINDSSVESEKLYLLSLNNDRQTIGCEVCHGAGKNHLLSPGEVRPVRRPPEEICTQCHTPDQDNNFDYQTKLAAIACPSD